MQITVYGKPNCRQCMMTKKTLDSMNLKYEYVDALAAGLVSELKQRFANGDALQMPVVLKDDELVAIGFMPQKLKELG